MPDVAGVELAHATEVPEPIPRAQPARIAEMLDAIARIGRDPDGRGITRLGFSPEEREAHELVGGWLRDLGLSVSHDAIGNLIAELPGSSPDRAAIGLGSHLDSVSHGGQYDGIVGVVGAVEVVRVMQERAITPAAPLRVVCFAAEEGARFGQACLGSRAVVGLHDQSTNQLVDATGTSVAEAMQAVGLVPSAARQAAWNPVEWAAFFELHIEQGRVLESAGRQIGLVDTVSGSTRLRLQFEGRADHSGGTPMALRSDALTAASELVLAAEAMATRPGHRGPRITIGFLKVEPNSITTIPGLVTLTVDIRDVDSNRQRETAGRIVDIANQACLRRRLGLTSVLIGDTSPVTLPHWLRGTTIQACEALELPFAVLTSGASHDAQVVNRIVPSALVFVPSRDGLSHVPEEWSSPVDIAVGADVLLESFVRLDAFLGTLRS